MVALIAFRALQGIGAGAIQPIASTVIGDIYTPAERARVQGYLSSVFGVSAIIGPALGAFLVEHVHWALVFWVNLPIGAISIAMFAAYLPEQVERRRRHIDYLGAIMLIVGVGAPMLALVQARSLDGSSLAALVGFGLAVLLFSVSCTRRESPSRWCRSVCGAIGSSRCPISASSAPDRR